MVECYNEMKHPLLTHLTIKHEDGIENKLEVEEFIGYEPSNYAWEDGYLCMDKGDVEYFVPLSGERVERREHDGSWYEMPGWECPVLVNESKLMTAALDKAYGFENGG